MKLKHYLIASPENHYQPWILSKTAMACFVLSIWTVRMLAPSYVAVGAPGLDNQDLMSRINQERTSRYLPALATNSKLSAAANLKSSDMLQRDYFAHVDPDGNYVWPLIEAQGYSPYQSLGENLAIDFFSAEAVVSAWMNSPGHRENILNEKFQDQGMAAVYGEFEKHQTYAITNLFGALLKQVASSSTEQPPASEPEPAQGTAPKTETKVTPKPEPVTKIEGPNSGPSEQAPSDAKPGSTPEQPADSSSAPASGDAVTGNLPQPADFDATSLVSMKVLLGLFALLYTFFLAVDSFIIHRAKVRRESISSSTHSALMLLIGLINLATLWI